MRTVASLSHVNSEHWDGLSHGDAPFQRHGFLMALEESGSVGPESGWHPIYLLVSRDEELIGGAAAYIKTDSYGEYIFDWGWARAASQFGQDYYPKLVIAAPFTPATGARLLYKYEGDRTLVYEVLAAGIAELVKRYELSSAHLLFCTDEEAEAMAAHGFSRRASYQFHWRNRAYKSFDEFLGQLKSRKRKQIRKERRRAQEAIDNLEFVSARDLRDEDLDALDSFYRKTVGEHGGFDYLRPGFFQAAAERMPDSMLFARVTMASKVVAGAVFFEGENSLFGRYWGSEAECEFLHFEVAYYAAIERCIDRGIALFEAGAQGQQKLMRGFEPAPTHSLHLFADPILSRAIEGFLVQEEQGVAHQMAELARTGPYRCDEG
ncbi:MAG: GNAT family N-acetyltransferase [Myxococcales bacterium]|nr:GNAT family N-acetyltransferase [Myxococcales bacterium]